MIDEEFNFADCLERQALKRPANEEVYKEILQLFQGETNKEEFLQRNAKNFSFKQNIMLLNETGAKSKTDHEIEAAWLQRVIQGGTKKSIPFLVILIST